MQLAAKSSFRPTSPGRLGLCSLHVYGRLQAPTLN